MKPHVPLAPLPFFAVLQALHDSVQAVSQQNPSTQLPDAHCALAMQAVPLASGVCV
jgi:hypothetical protein